MDLDDVKKDLRVIHAADDDILSRHLLAAEYESLQFCNRADWNDVGHKDGSAPHDVEQAQMLLIRAMYETVEPEKIAAYRQAAEAKLMPYRVCLGV